MDTTLDADLLKKNCSYYSSLHYKAVDVLRHANGKDNYKKIAKDLSLHETTVSGLLKEAKKLGLATKIGKSYKKIPGILKFVTTTKSKNSNFERIPNVIEKLSKKKLHSPPTKYENFLGINFGGRIEKMSNAYRWLYLTENTLRELIRKVFKNEQNWWKTRVNKQIVTDVEKAKTEYPYHGAVRKDELEFTHLGQLKEIIMAKKNWNLFLPFLNEKDKSNFKATVDKAIPSRNSIAHCTTLTEEDYKVVEVRFKDILKMIKS